MWLKMLIYIFGTSINIEIDIQYLMVEMGIFYKCLAPLNLIHSALLFGCRQCYGRFVEEGSQE